ncbi:nitrilase-related carbon-nitrogen hydrolase, partial [Acidithiobacillus sp.]|uniref:nitrilase-related carbon-nitrogen hydrolase n=1 Tax=Acidithiobacillus sp. TaxID=1872118 RepID=UPI003D0316E3
MRIALAQVNCQVGDVAGNADRLLAAAAEARAAGADLLLTPELALSGYPPEDLLLRTDFLQTCDAAMQRLAAEAPLPMLVGHPRRV